MKASMKRQRMRVAELSLKNFVFAHFVLKLSTRPDAHVQRFEIFVSGSH